MYKNFNEAIQRKFFSTADDKGIKPPVGGVLGKLYAFALPKNLQDWYLLSYADFIKELEKQKVKLSLSLKAEWEDYFTTEAIKVNGIKTQINAADKDIDAMVYELYGLSEEEIGIVESSN